MSAVNRIASLVSDFGHRPPPEAVTASRNSLIDTIACMFAGSAEEVAQRSMAAVQSWGAGVAPVFGTDARLSPPFAAMVNGASAHALDYDDYDAPANSHPSAVIFPALLAVAAERPTRGIDLLDAHIVGVEVMQRLGEAMNMDHYRRGWLTTLTLGSIGAAAACARLGRFDHGKAAAALSLAASMASGLTNQGGYHAKQMNPGFAAKNGVMASALAASGISASDQVIDGPISLARVMGSYDAGKFETALAKLARPWSIVEHGLFLKAYPCCGYTHRVVDAAIELHEQVTPHFDQIDSIRISVPDYYLDLLIYPRPQNPAQAMFSAEYNVAAALLRGGFGLAELSDAAIADTQSQRLTGLCRVDSRKPPDPDIVYDPVDPDWVEVILTDGRRFRADIELPTGSVSKPMDEAARRHKFDSCLQCSGTRVDPERLWRQLDRVEAADDLGFLLTG